MQLITSLASKLQADFPAYTFTASDTFYWSSDQAQIAFDSNSEDTAALLHELSHAVLAHAEYQKDITLIEMERDAWHYATSQLAPRYNITITDSMVQDALDTYRDWLHARSTCPQCKATGVQTKADQYKCIACSTKWRVNEARVCALRRYRI